MNAMAPRDGAWDKPPPGAPRTAVDRGASCKSEGDRRKDVLRKLPPRSYTSTA